jgi:hypothetical protein
MVCPHDTHNRERSEYRADFVMVFDVLLEQVENCKRNADRNEAHCSWNKSGALSIVLQ